VSAPSSGSTRAAKEHFHGLQGKTVIGRLQERTLALVKRSKLSREERATRRALSQSVTTQLRQLSKGTGWRFTKYILFREYRGWFISTISAVWLSEPRTTADFHIKPMALDPLFWEIVGLQSNNKEPLSFRGLAAWKCSTPPLAESDVPEGSGQPQEIARRILYWSAEQLNAISHQLTNESFLHFIQNHPRRTSGHYLETLVTTLVLMGREEMAQEVLTQAKARNEAGDFSAGGKSFVEMAREWIASYTERQILH
jgi:hypothetical protein